MVCIALNSFTGSKWLNLDLTVSCSLAVLAPESQTFALMGTPSIQNNFLKLSSLYLWHPSRPYSCLNGLQKHNIVTSRTSSVIPES